MSLSAALVIAFGIAAAEDVVVVDRGGGAERTAAVTRALATAMPGAVVLPAADAKDLDAQYIAPCALTDDDCLVRAMATIDVKGIVFVERAAVAVIETTRRRLRRAPAETTAAVGAALDDALHPEQKGTVTLTGLPPQATITVAGSPWSNAELPVGEQVLRVQAPGYEPKDVKVTVTGAQSTTVPVALVKTTAPPPTTTTPASSPPTSTPTPEPAATPVPVGLITSVVGASLGFGGAAAVIVGEVYVGEAIAGLQRFEPRGDDLNLWFGVQTVGFTVATVGVIAVAGGVGMMLMEPAP